MRGSDSFVSRIYAALGKPPIGKMQYQHRDGSWQYGRHRTIDRDMMRDHFLGAVTVALSCLTRNERALFLVIDIDRHFHRRLSIIARVLRQRGLDRAAFATEGSDAGRGKVVVTLAQPIPRAQAVTMVNSITDEAKCDPAFGEVRPDDLTLFPRGGSPEGNVVRLFGTNRARTTAIGEAALDLDGWTSDLPYLSPADVAPSPSVSLDHYQFPGDDSDLGQVGGAEPDTALHDLLTQPFIGNGAQAGRTMMRLAWAIREQNPADPAAAYDAMLDALIERSPNMTRGARENLRRASARKRALDKAMAKPRVQREDHLGEWKPLAEDRIASLPAAARKAYRTGTALLQRVRGNPHAFTIGYRQWNQLAQYSEPAACCKAVSEAEKAGLLFRIDRGSKGTGGLATMVAFVGDGETLQSVYDDAITTDMFQARLAERKQRDLPMPLHTVENGVPMYRRAT